MPCLLYAGCLLIYDSPYNRLMHPFTVKLILTIHPISNTLLRQDLLRQFPGIPSVAKNVCNSDKCVLDCLFGQFSMSPKVYIFAIAQIIETWNTIFTFQGFLLDSVQICSSFHATSEVLPKFS